MTCAVAAAEVVKVVEKQPWPAGGVEQIGTAKAAVSTAPATPAEVAAAFTGAPVPLVARRPAHGSAAPAVRGGLQRFRNVRPSAGKWWGSTGGPIAAGGDGVPGANVHNPWRTTPYVLPYAL